MDRVSIKEMLSLPLDALMIEADLVRKEHIGGSIELCGIMNAKSGACPEDCRFCAQSAHHSAHITKYPLKSVKEIVDAANKARINGARRFGIVTSGNVPTKKEIYVIAEAVREIDRSGEIQLCASLGALDEPAFGILRDAGLRRYHHNLETSRRNYGNIVFTHSYDERVDTVKKAKSMGFEVCSGGIIGMGEDWDDRVDMACFLKELDVDSVPINILVPVKGTPLEDCEQLTAADALRTIALFRLILKDKTIKVAAGRESVLRDHQEMMYSAGANGMMVGGYLTIGGGSVEDDMALVENVKKSWNKG